jgi:hypothetical protein
MNKKVFEDEVRFRFQVGDGPRNVFFRADQTALTRNSEAYVSAALLPAMQEGTDLEPPNTLDPLFAENCQTIQDIYSTWYDNAEPISINADTSSSSDTYEGQEGRTATFFTGGVDSFYTLLKHKKMIDALVYVHGFDVDLEDETLRHQVSEMVRTVGEELGKEVIEIETNLRAFSSNFASWGRYHGGALAAVGHTLANQISTIFIPSSYTYADLEPWGSHPLLDPLWGSDTSTFIHDGCEATRVEKCKKISNSEVALESLRTCWRNPGSVYNCGECNKCIRTKVNLYSVGALEECQTFKANINLGKVRRSHVSGHTRVFVKENVSYLKNKDGNKELIKALESSLKPPPAWKRALKNAKKVYYEMRIRIGGLLRRWGMHPRA